jgi:tetratricopeptide (TPR) repeat protein
MNLRAVISICRGLLAGVLLAGCAYVKHVPPGQSLNAATARKADLVALPAPPPQAMPVANVSGPEPELPAPLQTEKVADAFTLGNLCLQQGRYPEAIAAYQSAVKEDPSFADAWNNLAIAYQNTGQADKAMAAFKKYKTVAVH